MPVYITDSVLGTISRVPITGDTPAVWSSAPELAATGFLGVNGLKIHNGAVWATNLDKGTILRIRGEQLLATLNGTSQVALVEPDGGHSIVLTQADGLQNPTSVAVRGGTVYVTSGAYLTAEDPNLIRGRALSAASCSYRSALRAWGLRLTPRRGAQPPCPQGARAGPLRHAQVGEAEAPPRQGSSERCLCHARCGNRGTRPAAAVPQPGGSGRVWQE
ncbi:hypothetical protein ACFZAD_00845 [Streptomyces iakyrus]|uniref:hypothetical protein n=1 Tax=Streptomyces iakyrus TaxID=68219 RepID=UPI0036E598BB